MKTNTSKIDRILKKLKRRDPALFQALSKKIIQLSELDLVSINHLKNLKGDLCHLKRIRIRSLVLTFQVREDTIIFEDLVHHDQAYK